MAVTVLCVPSSLGRGAMAAAQDGAAPLIDADRLWVGWLWEGCRESRRCSRDAYPESYITKYTCILVYEDYSPEAPAELEQW